MFQTLQTKVAFTAFLDATLFSSAGVTKVPSTGEINLNKVKSRVVNSIVIGSSVDRMQISNLKDPVEIK